MAKFTPRIDPALTGSLETLETMDEESRWSILLAGAEALAQTIKEAILQRFKQHTGDLADSLKITEKTGANGSLAHVAPAGKHSRSSTGKRRPKGKGVFHGTNAEILYVLNYGSARISATHVFDDALDASEEAVTAAMQEAFNQYLDKLGL